MEITLYQNKQYIVRFYYKTKEGKRRNISITNKEWTTDTFTKREFKNTIAPIAMVERIKELDREEERRVKESCTIAKHVEQFLRVDETINKFTTNIGKKRIFDKYIIPYFDNNGDDVKNTITTQNAINFRLDLAKNNELVAVSKNRVLTNLKQFIDYLVAQKAIDGAEGYTIKANLKSFKKSENIEEDEAVENFWTKEEYNTFISTFEKGDPYRFFFFISFWCGTRFGETLGLKFNDFNAIDNTLYIQRQRISETQRITTTKTTSSKNKIRIPKHIFKALEEYKTLVNGGDEDYLFFPSFHGARTTIRRRLEEHIKLANVKPITIHGFRHSCASNLLANGFDYMDVCKYLRHASPDITLKVYSHWIEKKEGAKIDNLEE